MFGIRPRVRINHVAVYAAVSILIRANMIGILTIPRGGGGPDLHQMIFAPDEYLPMSWNRLCVLPSIFGSYSTTRNILIGGMWSFLANLAMRIKKDKAWAPYEKSTHREIPTIEAVWKGMPIGHDWDCGKEHPQ